jgi:nitroimidazol reductase NimA-like FMN-containing flavoprotein (pyridoxamine 5'-phosphate oxidase superfamily)
MQKPEREIKDKAEIEAIISRAEVCRLALAEGDVPYIIPMNFGYQDNCLYFHCAAEGKKLDVIRQNNQVCFEMDIDGQLVKPAERTCSWSYKYRSVIGFGKAAVIENSRDKSAALNIVTQHYGGQPHEFSAKETDKMLIIKVEISSMTGKKAGY